MGEWIRARCAAGLAAWACALLLSACGGGGGGSNGQGDTVVLSGTLTMAETASVDADTNDPHQADRHSNDDFDEAQPLITPVSLVGTVNDPNEGPDGPNKVFGDEGDLYVAALQEGQLVELTFSADLTSNLLGLAILDEQHRVVGAISAVGSSACLRIGQTGTYYIGVIAITGASRYNMRIGSPGDTSPCANTTSALTAPMLGELIALPRQAVRSIAGTVSGRAQAQGVQASALQQALGLQTQAGIQSNAVASGVPALLKLPTTAAAQTAGLAQLLSVSNFKRASALAMSTGDTGMRCAALAAVKRTMGYAQALAATGLYEYVALNGRASATQVSPQTWVGTYPPSDPFYSRQRWHYEQINLPAAMERLAGLATQPTGRPLVAVIDSGIMVDHPDLNAQIADGFTFLSINSGGDHNLSDPDDPTIAAPDEPAFHGTHVAGTIAARTFDGYGSAGVAPMAQLMPLRVFDPSRLGASDYDIIQAMLYAAGLPNNAGRLPTRKADVINMSLGGNSACPSSYQSTLDRVRAQGLIVVAAAGNGAKNDQGLAVAVGAPANCRGVVAVGALDINKRQTRYAQSGTDLRVMAPGGDITLSSTGTGSADLVYSTMAAFNESGVRVPSSGLKAGTSMAAPHMAGVVALMKYAYPGLTPDKLDEWLNAGLLTDDLGAAGRDTRTGYGLINARKAVDVALTEVHSPTQAPSGKLIASPYALDFGATRTSMTLEVLATAATPDVVLGITPSLGAISVSRVSASTGTGLGSYTVSVNRALLSTGTTFPTLTIQTSSGSVVVQLTVVKTAPGMSGRQADYGHVYVLALDAETGDTVAGTTVSASAGRYTWQIAAKQGKRVVLVAGTDLDNDGLICQSGEPCGAYPLLSTELTELSLTRDQFGLDFSLVPMGGTQTGTLSSQALRALGPFQRVTH